MFKLSHRVSPISNEIRISLFIAGLGHLKSFSNKFNKHNVTGLQNIICNFISRNNV